MERYAWKAVVLPGMLDEYIKRHDNIWPEMKEVLAAAGIRNYTIWNVGNELFGYYECDSVEYAAKVQADSPVVDKWNEYMKDVMVMELDPVTGAQPLMKQVLSSAKQTKKTAACYHAAVFFQDLGRTIRKRVPMPSQLETSI